MEKNKDVKNQIKSIQQILCPEKGLTPRQKLDVIIKWHELGDSPHGFDDSFIRQVAWNLEHHGTMRQLQAVGLDNIIQKFDIKVSDYTKHI